MKVKIQGRTFSGFDKITVVRDPENKVANVELDGLEEIPAGFKGRVLDNSTVLMVEDRVPLIFTNDDSDDDEDGE